MNKQKKQKIIRLELNIKDKYVHYVQVKKHNVYTYLPNAFPRHKLVDKLDI